MKIDLKKLDELIIDIEKSFGKGSIFFGNEGSNLEINRWPIESLVLNDGFGGGIPKGRLVEIYGPESNGKTSIACYLASQVQKQGGIVGYIDSEQTIDFKYASTFGLDLGRCLFNQPDCGEDGLDVAQKMVESQQIDLIVIDSVAALTPKAEIEGGMSDQQMGLQARMMSKACRKLAAICNKTGTTIIFINQIRMRMGGYGNPEVTTCGVALKFWCSIRIEIRKSSFVEIGTNEEKQQIGIISKIKFVKNKTSTPGKFGFIKILFGKGIQVEEEIIDFSLEYNVIQRKGTWYFYGEERLGQGKDNVIIELKNNENLYNKIKVETKNKMNKKEITEKNIDNITIEERKEIVEECNKILETLDLKENSNSIEEKITNEKIDLTKEEIPNKEIEVRKILKEEKKKAKKMIQPIEQEEYTNEVIDISNIGEENV